jgi:hypothetical protein
MDKGLREEGGRRIESAISEAGGERREEDSQLVRRKDEVPVRVRRDDDGEVYLYEGAEVDAVEWPDGNEEGSARVQKEATPERSGGRVGPRVSSARPFSPAEPEPDVEGNVGMDTLRLDPHEALAPATEALEAGSHADRRALRGASSQEASDASVPSVGTASPRKRPVYIDDSVDAPDSWGSRGEDERVAVWGDRGGLSQLDDHEWLTEGTGEPKHGNADVPQDWRPGERFGGVPENRRAENRERVERSASVSSTEHSQRRPPPPPIRGIASHRTDPPVPPGRPQEPLCAVNIDLGSGPQRVLLQAGQDPRDVALAVLSTVHLAAEVHASAVEQLTATLRRAMQQATQQHDE